MAGGNTVERIDTGTFASAIAAMDKAVEYFQNARKKIVSLTDPVVDSWQGEGAKEFGAVYKKLKLELEDEETNLATVRDDLIAIKETYEEWDRGTADSLTSE